MIGPAPGVDVDAWPNGLAGANPRPVGDSNCEAPPVSGDAPAPCEPCCWPGAPNGVKPRPGCGGCWPGAPNGVKPRPGCGGCWPGPAGMPPTPTWPRYTGWKSPSVI